MPRNKAFGHADARVTRRIAFNASEFVIALPYVEPRGLKADGIERDRGAAALPGLLLCRVEHAAPYPVTPQGIRHEDEVNKEQTQSRPPDQAADDNAGDNRGSARRGGRVSA